MHAQVTNIFHSARHDGRGLRTVVFFGGCNMRCAWCHNPEGLSAKPRLMFYAEKCVGCGECMGACDKISLKDGKMSLSDTCNLCGRCAEVCLGEALRPSSREMSVDEVMREVIKDKTYYRFSGGGVTASGGECLLYPEFLRELFGACREEGISTCIESALFVPRENITALLPITDEFIVDLKLISSAEHKKYTGVDNSRILENIKFLAENHNNVLVRTPLIPEVTDTEENLFGILAFLADASIREWELLRYNPLAGNKYAALGEEYRNFGERQSTEFVEKALEALNEKNTSVKVFAK